MDSQEAVENKSMVAVGVAFEDHYTVKQIARKWAMGVDSVRRIFENEPDVIRIGHPETLHKRKYITLLIPEGVLRRVHRKLSQVKPGKPN